MMIKTAAELDFRPKSFCIRWGIDTPDILGLDPALKERLIGGSSWSPKLPYSHPTFGTNDDFVKLYKAAYGADPDYDRAGCSLTGILMEQILMELGLTPPLDEAKRERLKWGMENLHPITGFGVWNCVTDKNSPYYHTGYFTCVGYQIQNGKLVVIYPKEARESEPLYPYRPK